MEIVESGPLTEAERAALEGEEPEPFGTEGIELRWRPKERHVMLRDRCGRALASTGLLVVAVSVDDAEPLTSSAWAASSSRQGSAGKASRGPSSRRPLTVRRGLPRACARRRELA
jgi:hypothetical protein